MRVISLFAALLLTTALSATGTAFADNHSRLNSIQTSGLLRVCIWPDYYGITYRNPRTLELSGIDIEMAQAFAKDLGVKVEFIDSSFALLVSDVTQERCDIAMFAIGITPQRASVLRFSSPHLASDIYAIAARSNERIQSWKDIDTKDTIVAVAKGTLHEPIMKESLKAATLTVVDTPFAREQEVRSGRADVFMTDYPYSQHFLASASWAKRIAPQKPFHVTPYAYAIKPGDDPWYQRVEAFVAKIKRDGRLKAAARRYALDTILAP